MEQMFTAEFFRGNRQKLRHLVTDAAPIVLTANGLTQRSTDVAYPFKQDGSFWYLTGIDEPNVVLVIDNATEYLIIPELSETRQAFDGAIDTNELTAISGIADVMLETAGWKRLGMSLKKASDVGVISSAQAYLEGLGMYTNPARRRLIKQLKQYNPSVALIDMRQQIAQQRMVKQLVELKALTRAIDITTQALKAIQKKHTRQAYANEYEVELELTKAFWRGGAAGHAFEPIVAAGKKAATIHPFGNDGPIDYTASLLLDVGAEFDHYCADISRTWHPVPGKRYQAVYAAVRTTADYAMSLLKPGVLMKEYELQVHAYMGEKLRELGLVKTINPTHIRQYFPHATSHFLGIDVHDVGDYEHPLEAGVVLTVEPGIYIPEEGIGVRIEDDVLITKTGCKNLSGALAR